MRSCRLVFCAPSARTAPRRTSISACWHRPIGRKDPMSLTREAEDVTGIPYVMDAYRSEAEAIIEGYSV